MRVLVTGASGMLGQDICKTFSSAGHEVIATDRDSLDITNRQAVDEAIIARQPDAIINTAAYNFVDKVEDPAVYPIAYAINATGPGNLAQATSTRNIPFVHYSTDYVFAGNKPKGYVESDEPDPISKYGETKAFGEAAVKKAGGRWYILRLSKIFGNPGTSEASKESFVQLMLRLAKEKPSLQIVDEEVGCNSYTKDIAQATLKLLTERAPGGIYHLVNEGHGVTWFGFAQEIFRVAGITTPRTPVGANAFPPRPAARPKFAKLINTLGPKLRSREEALKDFLASNIDNPSAPLVPFDLSVIVVSWNVRELLKQNLTRIFEIKPKHPFEVIVVDNGSSDNSARMVREEFPNVHLIQNDTNRGFAFACNQGLRMARGSVLVLFNPDMIIGDDALDHAYETLMARKDIGVMGVKLLRPDGTIVESVRRDPGLRDQVAILLKLPHLFPNVTDRYLARGFDYSTSQEVEQVRGSFFAFRKDTLDRIGALDDKRFFVWFEEVDFCRRVRQAGYRVWYSAQAQCVDLVGQGFKQQSVRLKQARMSLSMARYFKKWHPAWQAWIIYALRPLAILMGVIADVVGVKTSLWK
jgi:dTDP-4-dehydrorhamnose reductase